MRNVHISSCAPTTLAIVIHIFTARVQDGRLVLNETPESLKLSEGESIDLFAIEELLFQGGALTAEDEKAALDRALVISLAEEEAGLALDFEEPLDDLRDKRRNAGRDGGAS
jgi:hypothetical protein